jgi:LuxR family maltose regulon positive regulatory protein
MSLVQVLNTKLYIPRQRTSLVARPRLIEQLPQGLRAGHRLTLLSAPPGFGKTTLLSNLKSHIPNSKMAWLSLDEGDNDLVRFLMYVVGALQTVV